MIKRTVLCIILCIVAFPKGLAAVVEVDDAKAKAMQFLTERNATALHAPSRTPVQTTPELEIAHVEISNDNALYYVFNEGKDDGFIVVSADDRTPSVLCYVDDGCYSPDDMAPATRELFSQYAGYVENAKRGAKLQASLPVQKPIYPLLRTNWNQGFPYNMKCPGECLTGCVATALAQILYYYHWPDAAVGTKTYYYNGNTLTVDFGEEYDYDSMLASSFYASDSIAANAVSTLMYHVGMASEMMYGESASAASIEIALDGMKRHFKYNENARIEYADNYERARWETELYNELAAERPVLYAGQGDSDAHAYVLDGYENGYFHINWGWGGLSNGYFLLVETTYPIDQAAYFDFKPIDHSTVTTHTDDGFFRLGYCDDAICARYGGEGTLGGAILLTQDYLSAYKGKTISGMEIGLSAESENFEYFVFKAEDGQYHNDIDIVNKEMLISGTVGKGKTGWNRIMFDEPLEINGDDGLYLGYYVTNPTLSYPISGSMHEEWKDETMNYAAMYFQNGAWECDPYESLNIRALVVNDDLPVDMRLLNANNVRCAESDGSFNILISADNSSADTISNFTIGYQLDNGEIAYHTEECLLAPNKTNHYSIPVDIKWPAGVYALKVWIEKVNGKSDAVPANSNYYRAHPLQLIISGQKFERRTVMESYVSSNCGFSNNVTIADSILTGKYPDRLIGIIVHEGNNEDDPLNIHENYNWWAYVTPTARLNRVTYEDPSVAGLENSLLAIEDADFDISMKACFSDSEKKTVDVLSTIVSGFDLNNEWYRIAYAVIENDVHVPGDPNVYQKIARGIYNSESGITNSLPKNMKAGTTYQNGYRIKLPLNVDNPSQIVIVAMIVNQVTGEIENAFSCVPADNGDTGISFIEKNITLEPDCCIQLGLTGVTDEMQLVWTSGNPDIVTVSQTGLATASSTVGKADVSVYVKDKPELMSTCTIYVMANPEITVTTPGTLSALIGDDISSIFRLKINGSLNALDLETLRIMTTDGNLETLDLSDARFIRDDNVLYMNSTCSIHQDDIIPYRAFEECIKLKEFICPKSCVAIEANAFICCSSLESITLFEGLKSIDYYAFDGTAITELHLPASLTYLSNYCYDNNISSITIADGNDSLVCIDNVVYDRTMEKLLYYPGGKTDEVFVSQTVRISIDGEGGFSRNPYLRKVYLPNAEKVHLSENNTFSFLYLGPNLKHFSILIFWFNINRITTLVCDAAQPPIIDDPDLIPEIYQEDWLGIIDLYVPSESINLYKADSIWGKLNCLPIEEYKGDSIYDTIQVLRNTYFTITYSIDGSVIHQEQVRYGDIISKYADIPQKEGYTLIGWDSLPTYMPAHDITVNGIYYSMVTGDANNDTEVNVGDFASTVNYILERPAPGFVNLMADVDTNGDINIADVVGITNIILDYDYPLYASSHFPERNADNAYDDLSMSLLSVTETEITLSLNLKTPNNYSAFQLDISTPEGLGLKSARLSDNQRNAHIVSFNQLVNGDWRVLSASLNNSQLYTDDESLLILVFDRGKADDALISVHDALLSDRNLNVSSLSEFGMTVSGPVTGLNGISVEGTGNEYQINGMKREAGSESNGIVIINGQKVYRHE